MGAVVALCRLRLAHSGADAMLRVLQEHLPALASAPPAAMERLWAVLQAGVAVAGTLISDVDLSTMHQDWKVQPRVAVLIEKYQLCNPVHMCRMTTSIDIKIRNHFAAAVQLSAVKLGCVHVLRQAKGGNSDSDAHGVLQSVRSQHLQVLRASLHLQGPAG